MAGGPRRIVQIGPAWPLRGGNVLFAAHCYHALAPGHDVHAISFRRLYPGLLFPGTRQTDVSGVAIRPHPAEPILDGVNPLTWYAAARRIRALAPDLILVHWWNPFFGPLHGTIARLIRRRSTAPILFVCENLLSHEERFVETALTRFALRHGDCFTALSESVQRDIERLFPGKPVYRSAVPIYDCYTLDPALTRAAARRALGIGEGKVVLFFGYIRPYKGLDVLLDAFPAVARALPDARLLIVGESYEDIGKYERRIQTLGLGDRVTLINRFVANEEVGPYYTAADVVCLPYRSATQSGILNIAYGMERPVIVTNVGGLAESVVEGKTGFVVPPEDREALARAITRFFTEFAEHDFVPAIRAEAARNAFGEFVAQVDDVLARHPVVRWT